MANRTTAQLSFADESQEYREFVDKFKPKKTTDDCYTPPEIYDVVLDYVVTRYRVDSSRVIRPFWPNGDYEREEYPVDAVVVDNPPFSIISRICDFYLKHGIRFFLFAPTLTLLHAAGTKNALKTNHIVCHTSITYANGAKVATSFVTNLDSDGTILESAPDLGDKINEKDRELQAAIKKHTPKYEYPDHVITAAKVNWYSAHHTPYKVNKRDCCLIGKLDAMNGKTIFGGGLLLSDRAAAERAAAERAAAERAAAERAAAHKWTLSERERAMVQLLNKQGGGQWNLKSRT